MAPNPNNLNFYCTDCNKPIPNCSCLDDHEEQQRLHEEHTRLQVRNATLQRELLLMQLNLKMMNLIFNKKEYCKQLRTELLKNKTMCLKLQSGLIQVLDLKIDLLNTIKSTDLKLSAYLDLMGNLNAQISDYERIISELEAQNERIERLEREMEREYAETLRELDQRSQIFLGLI